MTPNKDKCGASVAGEFSYLLQGSTQAFTLSIRVPHYMVLLKRWEDERKKTHCMGNPSKVECDTDMSSATRHGRGVEIHQVAARGYVFGLGVDNRRESDPFYTSREFSADAQTITVEGDEGGGGATLWT